MLGDSAQPPPAAGQAVTVATVPPDGAAPVTAVPPAPQPHREFATGSCAKDAPWGYAYLVCWLAVTVAAIVAGMNTDIDGKFGNTAAVNGYLKDYEWTMKGSWPIAVYPLAAFGFCALWLAIMSALAQSIIKFCLIAHVAAWCILAGLALVHGAVMPMVLNGVFALLSGLYAAWVWRRIAFSEACLVSAVSVFRMNRWPLFVHLMSAVFVCGTVLACCAAAMTVEHYMTGNGKAFVLILVLLVFMWSLQIHVNAAWVVSSSVAGQFLCIAPVPSPTWTAWKRAYSVLFGSICFGSFIEAAIRTLRIIVSYARGNQRDGSPMLACVLCCIDCLLQILSDILEYVNSYAYIHVALYGKDYRQAIRDTFHMFRTTGLEALINDDMTTMPMIVGVVLFVVSMGISIAVFAPESVQTPPGVLGLLLAMAVVLCTMTVLTAYAKTLFVAWAQDIQGLASRNPTVCQRLTMAARAMSYNLPLPAA